MPLIVLRLQLNMVAASCVWQVIIRLLVEGVAPAAWDNTKRDYERGENISLLISFWMRMSMFPISRYD